MTIASITSETLAEYIHVDAEDPLLPGILEAAKAYCVSYTGHTLEELNTIPEMWIAVCSLASDMYDNRSVNVKEEGVNQTVMTILSMHSCNYI